MAEEPRTPEEKIVFDPFPKPADEQYPIPVDEDHQSSNAHPNRPMQSQVYSHDPTSAKTMESSDTQPPPYKSPAMADAVPVNGSPAVSPDSRVGHTNQTPVNSFPQPEHMMSMPKTVTPLHLLGDQTDTIDCPFCQQRSETKIKKAASQKTYIASTILFFTTFFGVCVPCMCSWYYDLDHHCNACGRRVTHKPHDAETPEVFGTPDHLREVSKYPAAAPRTS